MADELDTSTHGLTVTWLDKYDSFGILHASSLLVIAIGWKCREDAVAAADRMDGVLPWAANSDKLREAPDEVVTDVAYLVSESGGTFLVHPSRTGGDGHG